MEGVHCQLEIEGMGEIHTRAHMRVWGSMVSSSIPWSKDGRWSNCSGLHSGSVPY